MFSVIYGTIGILQSNKKEDVKKSTYPPDQYPWKNRSKKSYSRTSDRYCCHISQPFRAIQFYQQVDRP